MTIFRLPLLLFSLLAAPMLFAQMPVAPVAPGDEAAVRNILDRYVDAWLRNDEAAVLALFEERGRIQPSGMCPFDSLHNIRAFWFPKDGSVTTIHQFQIEVQDLHALGKDLIFSAQSTRLYWSYHLGSTHLGKLQYGYATTVFRRQSDGTWKIWRQAWTDLASVNTAPVPPGAPPLNVAVEIPENDLIPEGIAFDAATGDLYLSSTWKRKIVKISANGTVTDFAKPAQDGLLGVIGMRVDATRRRLWVATGSAGTNMPVQGLTDAQNWKSGLFQYDLNSGRCLGQYWLDAPGQSFFLNDLTIDASGRVFVTEMVNRRIYTLAPGSTALELFLQLPDGHAPNGIDLDDKERYLFVALYTRPRSFGRVDLHNKQLTYVTLPPREEVGADGLYFYKNSLVAVQPSVKDRQVTQYFLNDALSEVVKMTVLLPDDPLLVQPSTGVVAGDRFYFIANSQLQVFAKHFSDEGGEVIPEKLLPVRIGVLGL